jgi:hypothetical protein
LFQKVRHKEDEFFPDLALDVVAQRGVDLAPSAGLEEILAPAGSASVVFAEHETLHRSGVRDDPGLRDRRGDVAQAADDRSIAEHAAQHVILVDAVLE